jgi:hypothetical protein
MPESVRKIAGLFAELGECLFNLTYLRPDTDLLGKHQATAEHLERLVYQAFLAVHLSQVDTTGDFRLAIGVPFAYLERLQVQWERGVKIALRLGQFAEIVEGTGDVHLVVEGLGQIQALLKRLPSLITSAKSLKLASNASQGARDAERKVLHRKNIETFLMGGEGLMVFAEAVENTAPNSQREGFSDPVAGFSELLAAAFAMAQRFIEVADAPVDEAEHGPNLPLAIDVTLRQSKRFHGVGESLLVVRMDVQGERLQAQASGYSRGIADRLGQLFGFRPESPDVIPAFYTPLLQAKLQQEIDTPARIRGGRRYI